MEQLKYKALKKWRSNQALKERIPVFMVLSNQSLLHLARIQPTLIEDLPQFPGIGLKKLEKYGDELYALIQSI